MNKGLYNILRKIAESPDNTKLEDRYLMLVDELDSSEKTDAILDLSHLIVENNPKKALKLARQVTDESADHSKKRAAKIIKLAVVKIDNFSKEAKEIKKTEDQRLTKKEFTRVTTSNEFDKGDSHTNTISRVKKSVYADAKLAEPIVEAAKSRKENSNLAEAADVKLGEHSLIQSDIPDAIDSEASVPTDLELRNVPSMVGKADEAIKSVEIKPALRAEKEYSPVTLDKTQVGEFQVDILSKVVAMQSAFNDFETQLDPDLVLQDSKEVELAQAKVELAEPKMELAEPKVEIDEATHVNEEVEEVVAESHYSDVDKVRATEQIQEVMAVSKPRLDESQVEFVVRMKHKYQNKSHNVEDILDGMRVLDWTPEFIMGLVEELWGPHYDQSLVVMLEKSAAMSTSPELWDVYLAARLKTGTPRAVLSEIQSRIRTQDATEWCLVAYKHLKIVSKLLHLQPIEWSPDVGGGYLRQALSQRLTPGVLAVAV